MPRGGRGIGRPRRQRREPEVEPDPQFDDDDDTGDFYEETNRSSWINVVEWNRDTGIMSMHIQRGFLVYAGVPRLIALSVAEAISVGRAYNFQIKGRFRYLKGSRPPPPSDEDFDGGSEPDPEQRRRRRPRGGRR